MNVIELRNYLLKEGKRDEFIQYFKDHFVHSQLHAGVHIPALFTIKNEEHRFVWIRGFDNMEQRSRFLPLFYGGEVWEKSGPAANDMMLEWHNVYLLKPLHSDEAAFSPSNGFFVIDHYKVKNHKHNDMIDLLTKEYILLFRQQNVKPITLWVSEMTPNDFPRLPVYQDSNLLTVISRFNDEEEYGLIVNSADSAMQQLTAKIDSLTDSKTSLLLYPINI